MLTQDTAHFADGDIAILNIFWYPAIFSLNNKRYNWRHDNVLRVIAKALMDQIEKFNNKDFKLEVQEWTVFKSSSSSYQKPITKMKRESPFEKGHDWKIIWDEDDLPAQFPQHIYGTAERPDIVVWSDKERTVIFSRVDCW